MQPGHGGDPRAAGSTGAPAREACGSTLRSLRSRCRSSEPRMSCRVKMSLYSQRLRCSNQAATSSVPQRCTVRDGKARAQVSARSPAPGRQRPAYPNIPRPQAPPKAPAAGTPTFPGTSTPSNPSSRHPPPGPRRHPKPVQKGDGLPPSEGREQGRGWCLFLRGAGSLAPGGTGGPARR